ncbi:cytochrome P450 2C5-like [Mantella aurantiaca]
MIESRSLGGLHTLKGTDTHQISSYSTMEDIAEDMFSMDPVTVIVSIIVILFLANVYNKQKQQKSKNLPPGPRPIPLIGSIHLIDLKRPHESFIELSKQYGPVYTIQLGISKMVILCGYDAVKEALVNQGDDFVDRPKMPLFNKINKGHGIVISNGENWKAMRRFAISTLRDYGMGKKGIEDKITEEAECLVQTFRTYEGKPFDNRIILNAAVANIIVSMLLNRRFEYDDPTLLKLMNHFNENVRLLGTTMARLYDMFPKLIDPLPGTHKTIIANFKQVYDFMRHTFTKQRKDLDVNHQTNIVDAFLIKQQEDKPESKLYYHDENLTALVVQLFGAGMETTATTLRWSLLIMIKYPEIQRKVQKEIEKIISTAQPKAEHRKQMPYTDAVVCEVQRFGDIVPGNIPHATTRDITFRGYLIPKGTTIIPLLSSILKDKAYFAKPDEFYPEHFLDADGNFKKNDAFIPFSAGKRSCAGESLAKMELFIFFTTLLQNFTFQAPPGTVVDLTPTLGSTNAPLPHKICAIPRN